ncbi:MAG: diguanylate cyclase [Rhodocyclaceae bacterium]|nr:diguanylate cyclase [Rhodocyclaceae bacterium]
MGQFSQIASRFSLRQVLTAPYVALVLLLTATLGSLSYLAGASAVDAVSKDHLREIVGRIGQAVDRHIVGSGAVLEAAFPEGMAAPESLVSELDELRTRFWIATSLHRDPNNYVYFGNEQGQFIGLYRHSQEDAELRFKQFEGESRTLFKFHGIDGYLEFSSREKRVYDPRQRPWYEAGRAASSHTWTAVYIDFRTSELVATRARRVLDSKGNFSGVVATDVSLNDLNSFVGRLDISPNGLAFIVEPDGALIAASTSPNVRRLPDGTASRVNAMESGNPLIQRAYEAVREATSAMGGNLQGPVARTLEGPLNEAVYIAFDRIKDDAGLEWITVVAVPRSDFMHGVSDNLLAVALAGFVAAALALWIGVRVMKWVTRDLARLADAAQRFGDGETPGPLGIERQDEIGDLARSFELMQRHLRTDRLTGLANREAFVRELERRIQRRQASERKGDGFAVLFVDLNRFKQVNDVLGHDVGDKVLVEVGRRIAAKVRAEDLVARYAGDEFVVLLDSVDSADNALRVRAEIELALSRPYAAGEHKALSRIGFGGAVGLALYPQHGRSAEDLLRNADREMYVRKFAARGESGGVTDIRGGNA